MDIRGKSSDKTVELFWEPTLNFGVKTMANLLPTPLFVKNTELITLSSLFIRIKAVHCIHLDLWFERLTRVEFLIN